MAGEPCQSPQMKKRLKQQKYWFYSIMLKIAWIKHVNNDED